MPSCRERVCMLEAHGHIVETLVHAFLQGIEADPYFANLRREEVLQHLTGIFDCAHRPS